MKKIFTLILLALSAITVNAQEKHYSAAGDNGYWYQFYVEGDGTANITWLHKSPEATLPANLVIPDSLVEEIKNGDEIIETNKYKVTTIGDVMTSSNYAICNAADGWDAIESITISEGIEEITSSAFWGFPVKWVSLPSTMRTIGSYVFDGCTQLERIIFNGIPRSVGEKLSGWNEATSSYYASVVCSYENVAGVKKALMGYNNEITIKVWGAEMKETEEVYAGLVNGIYADSVSVTRTLNAGEWTPITLPFNLSQEQFQTTFGNDTKLAELTGFENDEAKFTSVAAGDTYFVANKPYLICTTKAMSDFKVRWVRLITDNTNLNQTAGDLKFSGTLNYSSSGYRGQFVYEDGIIVKKMAPVMAMSGFFENNNAFVDEFTVTIDGVPSGIQNARLDSELKSMPIYDLQGRRVSGKTKGLYIQNGKKLVRR